LKDLIKNSGWKLLKVTNGEITIGFVLVSFFRETVDQFALAYNRFYKDSSRTTILACIEHLSGQNSHKFYNLGGGIQEEDSLFNYKISFGGCVKSGTVIKYCSQKHDLFRDVLDVSLENWPVKFG